MVFSLPILPTIVSWDIKSKLKILVWFMQSLTLYKCTCVPLPQETTVMPWSTIRRSCPCPRGVGTNWGRPLPIGG